MAGEADQEIILDTTIDSQGLKKGSAEMKKAIASLSRQMESLGPVFDKAAQKDVKALQKLGDKSSDLEYKIKSLRDKMAGLGDVKIPTLEYSRITDELEQCQNEFDKLKAKDEKAWNTEELKRYQQELAEIEETRRKTVDYNQQVINNGGTPDWAKENAAKQIEAANALAKSQAADLEKQYAKPLDNVGKIDDELDKVSAKLSELKAKKEALEQNGQSTINASETGEFKQLSAEIEEMEGELAGLTPKAAKAANSIHGILGTAFRQIAANWRSSADEIILFTLGPFYDAFANAAQKIYSASQNPKQAFDSLKAKAASVGASIKNAFQNPQQAISSLASSIKAKLSGAFSNVQDNARNLGGTLGANLKSSLSAAGTAAGKLAAKLGGAALSGAKRLGSSIKSGIVNGLKKAVSGAKSLAKSLGSKLVGQIEKAGSGLSSMDKSAEGVRKKITRMGLALIGMRGVWGGIRQIVSSALDNNEKLQNQLTAVKGVLGQALAPAINILVKGLGQMVTFADQIYQIFTGTSLIAQYNAGQQKKAADNIKQQTKNAKEAERQLAGFDSLNILSDSSKNDSDSGSSSSDDTTASLFKKTDISGWLSDIIDQIKKGDWYSVGSTIADAINSALYKIDWANIQDKVNTFCTNLGKAVNGFVDTLDWGAAGNAFGEGINTLTGAVNSFVDTVNWDNLGAGLSEGLNKAVKTVDGEALGKTLSAKLKIMTDTLYGFFNGNEKYGGFDFKSLGNTLGDTVNGWFENIDWKKTGSNITSGIAGLGDTISGAADSIDWSGITKSIEDFFEGMDWANALSKLFTGLGKALGGMGSVVVQLLKDAWDSWKKDYLDPAINDCGGNIIEGVFVGIGNWLHDVGSWIKTNIFDPFINGFKSTFDIHSPSKNQDILDLGKNLIEGIFNGIVDWLKDIKTWFQTNVFDKITGAWDDFKELTLSIGASISDKFNDAVDKWNSVKEGVKESIASFKEKLSEGFQGAIDKWNGIKEGTKNAVANLSAKVAEGFDDIKKKWDDLKGKTAEAKMKIASKWSDFKTKWNDLKSNFTGKTSDMKMKIASKWSDFKTKWNKLKSNFKGKTVSLTAKFKDAVTGALNTFIGKINAVIAKLRAIKIGTLEPFKNLKDIPKLAKGGVVNNPGAGVPAVIGEAGPEAVLPLKKSVLSALASLIVEQMQSSLFSVLTGIVRQAVSSIAKSSRPVTKIGDSALISSVDGINSTLDSGFSTVASQLQAIANGVSFKIPQAVNLIPYRNRDGGDGKLSKINEMLDVSNDELISVLIQLFNNQTHDLVNALKALKVVVSIDKQKQVQDMIDEINRRTRITGRSPLLR